MVDIQGVGCKDREIQHTDAPTGQRLCPGTISLSPVMTDEEQDSAASKPNQQQRKPLEMVVGIGPLRQESQADQESQHANP